MSGCWARNFRVATGPLFWNGKVATVMRFKPSFCAARLVGGLKSVAWIRPVRSAIKRSGVPPICMMFMSLSRLSPIFANAYRVATMVEPLTLATPTNFPLRFLRGFYCFPGHQPIIRRYRSRRNENSVHPFETASNNGCAGYLNEGCIADEQRHHCDFSARTNNRNVETILGINS